MKQYKALIIAMLVILIAGLTAVAAVFSGDSGSDDLLLLNDIAKSAAEHIDSPEELAELVSETPCIILDSGGNVVFSSSGAKVTGLSDAVKSHYPYMIMTDGDRIVGAVIIPESPEALCEKRVKTAMVIFVLTGFAIVGCIVLWSIYVRRNIVEPFRKMERFAEDIAGGNLDIPLEMDRGNMFGSFTGSFDIMREELAAARDREIMLKKREKELIASLSHDLKTPITGIKLTAELMQAQTDDPSATEKLGNIYRKAEQIDALVSDLLTSTLKDLGEMKVTVTAESSAVLREFVSRCDDRGLTEETSIPECIISIDSRRMEQVIWNVISNSCKYAGTKISITYELVDNFLRMSIRDYGEGVPEEELLLLTNKFYRGKSSAESSIEGSGLGLYIAKTLMDRMNGDLICLNADPGFEVRLYIPLA